MDDLVRWLGACLDEDERIARAAGGLAWSRSPEYLGDPAAIRDSEQERVVCYEGWPSEGQAVHIAEHDPARVLREVEAKRRIVEQHRPVGYGGVCLSLCHTRAPGQPQSWPCLTLRLLALPYAGREGYRPEWAPPE